MDQLQDDRYIPYLSKYIIIYHFMNTIAVMFAVEIAWREILGLLCPIVYE